MPLKERSGQISPEAPAQGNEWDGPWGSISPAPHSVETLCVRLETEIRKPCIYYYPYRTIGKWNWKMDAPETLEIQAGGVLLTVSGTGLHRLAEAMNLGQLRLVHLPAPPQSIGEIGIRAILIEDMKN
jgi:hypothetical protein